MANEKVVYTIDVNGNASTKIDEAKKKYDDFKKNIEAPVKEIPLTRQLRDLKMEMVKLDQNGMGGSKAFLELANKAGSIKDSITAANDQIKTMAVGSQLEKNINFAKGGFEALAGATQATTGILAVFGTKSQQIEMFMQKSVATMTAVNGVRLLFNSLTKEGAFVTGLMATKTAAAATVQGLYTAAIGTSTGALKALKIAMMGTGILALVAGIGWAISKFIEFKNKTAESNAEMERTKKINDAAAISIKNNGEAAAKATDEYKKLYIENLKNNGEANKALKIELSDQQAIIDKIKEKEKIASEQYKENEAAFKKLDGVQKNANKQDYDIAQEVLKTSLVQIRAEKKLEEERIKGIKPISVEAKNTLKTKVEQTNKLVNSAPKTFNVYIDRLGEISGDVFNAGIKDDKEFQQKFVDTLLSALNTVSVQAG